jgi:hypothetical protein
MKSLLSNPWKKLTLFLALCFATLIPVYAFGQSSSPLRSLSIPAVCYPFETIETEILNSFGDENSVVFQISAGTYFETSDITLNSYFYMVTPSVFVSVLVNDEVACIVAVADPRTEVDSQ